MSLGFLALGEREGLGYSGGLALLLSPLLSPPHPPPKDCWRYISIHKLSFFAAHCSGKVKKWVGEEIGYKTLSDWKPDVVTPEKCVAKAEKVLMCY